jgi:hypothetical protein
MGRGERDGLLTHPVGEEVGFLAVPEQGELELLLAKTKTPIRPGNERAADFETEMDEMVKLSDYTLWMRPSLMMEKLILLYSSYSASTSFTVTADKTPLLVSTKSIEQ